MKKVKCVFLSVTLIIVLTFFISSCKNSGDIAETKTEQYNKEEYELVMSSLKNDAILYYSENHNETDFSDSFWDKKYNEKEKTPKEYLNKMNMDNPEKLATLLQAFFVGK